MTKLADIFDLGLLDEMMAEGLVKRFEHDSGDIAGFHYAERAQWDRIWNRVTINCRGLIADTAGNVLARPFPKFFNLGDDPERDAAYGLRMPVLWEKLDGSLGVHFLWRGEGHVATKGSFHSEQAQWATDWWRTNVGSPPPPGETDLFEIIYPANRVIVDYGDRSELVHLARLRNADAARVEGAPEGAARVRLLGRHTHAAEAERSLAEVNDGNFEGVVAEWPDGHRVKVKLSEYLRLHRIMSSTSTRTIWEALSSGTGIGPLLDATPDEFQSWVQAEAWRMIDTFDMTAESARYWFCKMRRPGQTRAEFAELAKAHDWPAVMFSLLDGKDDRFEEQVWRMLRPERAEFPPIGPAATEVRP